MKQEDEMEFGKLMVVLSSVYRQELNSVAVEAYFTVLGQQYSIGELKACLPAILTKCKFLPSIAEIIEICDPLIFRNLDNEPMADWMIEKQKSKRMAIWQERQKLKMLPGGK